MTIDDVIAENPWMAEFKDEMYEKCHDCGVSLGEEHEAGCDNARCSKCGSQWIACGHEGGEHDRFLGLFCPELYRICLEQNYWCRDIACCNGREEVITSDEMSRFCIHLQFGNYPGFKIKWHQPCERIDRGAHPDMNRAAMYNAAHFRPKG